MHGQAEMLLGKRGPRPARPAPTHRNSLRRIIEALRSSAPSAARQGRVRRPQASSTVRGGWWRAYSGRSARAARPVASRSLPPPDRAATAEFGHVLSPARTGMHSGVIAHSFGGDEPAPALRLRLELAHVHVPRPGCSDGRQQEQTAHCRALPNLRFQN